MSAMMDGRPNPLDEALRNASQSLMFTGSGLHALPVNTEAQTIRALAAQALATVALAEEQHTANLLALLALAQAVPTYDRTTVGLDPEVVVELLSVVITRLGVDS